MEDDFKVKFQQYIDSLLAEEKIDSGDYITLKTALEDMHDNSLAMWTFIFIMLMFLKSPLSPKGDEKHES